MRFYIIFILLCLLSSCGENEETMRVANMHELKNVALRHAKRFSISYSGSYKLVCLYGEKDIIDTTECLVLYQDEKPELGLANCRYIKCPTKRIASLSSIYSNMIVSLNEIEKITGIENVDYYHNNLIIERVSSGIIREVQRGPDIDIEQLISLNPEVVFSFGVGINTETVDRRLEKQNINVVYLTDQLEDTPLARAEWIKFFACFINEDSLANIYFDKVESNYNELKNMVKDVAFKPKVITEIKYGDSWFVPSGQSYLAKLIKDAGAKYIFDSINSPGSVPMSFETVYSYGKDAEYWLNLSLCKSKEDVLSQDKRYANFKAYKDGNLYNNTLHCNIKGYSNYWEDGFVNPDRILSDFIKIFHPNLTDSINSNYHFYEKLK